jgi:hypothetical protein
MAREPKTGKKPIEQYDHKDKKRVNNPPVGLVTPELDREKGVKAYAYDPHLDPQLQWSGNESFWLVGQPDVRLKKIKDKKNASKYQVEVQGFDYYNTRTGAIESGGPEKIAVKIVDDRGIESLKIMEVA